MKGVGFSLRGRSLKTPLPSYDLEALEDMGRCFRGLSGSLKVFRWSPNHNPVGSLDHRDCICMLDFVFEDLKVKATSELIEVI